MGKCEFAGDSNTVGGKLVPCQGDAEVVMRPSGEDALTWAMSRRTKPRVCDVHMQVMISVKVKAAGREWSIDHFVREEKRVRRSSKSED